MRRKRFQMGIVGHSELADLAGAKAERGALHGMNTMTMVATSTPPQWRIWPTRSPGGSYGDWGNLNLLQFLGTGESRANNSSTF